MAHDKRSQQRQLGVMTPREMSDGVYGHSGDSQRVTELETALADLQTRAVVVISTSGETMALFGCEMSGAGLDVPDTITNAALFDALHILFSFEEHIQLMVGDALAAMERLKYGAIEDIAKSFARDGKTLRNWKSICKKVELSLRRDVLAAHPNARPLTISHYDLIRAFNEADQRYWIASALSGGWSVTRLRLEIASAAGRRVIRRTKYQRFQDDVLELGDTVRGFKGDQRQEAIAYLRQVLDDIEAE